MSLQPFLLDGVAYNVSVTGLKRSFSVLDTDNSGRTQDGEMYRDIIGTFYNYEMTVRQRGDDRAALGAYYLNQTTPEWVLTRLDDGESISSALEQEGLSSQFSSDFETSTQNGRHVFGDGSCRIRVEAVSGSVHIYKGSGSCHENHP